MKRVSSPPDRTLRFTPAGDDWTYLRVKLTRQERDVFDAITRRYGASPSEALRDWVCRVNTAAAISDGRPDYESDVLSTSASDSVQVSGVHVGQLSELGSDAARSAHERWVAACRLPRVGGGTAEGSETLDDPVADRRVQRAVAASFLELMRCDKLVPTAGFLARSGWTKEALTEKTSRIFHFALEDIQLYPTFFLDPRYDRKSLGSVCKILEGLPDGSKWMFFTTTKASLALPAKRGQRNGIPRTPLQVLEAGEVEAVKACALGFRER